MTIKMNYRMPTTAFGYVELEVAGNTSTDIERDVASMQKLFGASIQIAGGGDSTSAAERLLKEELGAERINEDGSPWEQPQAPVQQAWASGPPVESAGPPPFGAPAPTTNAFGATVATAQRSPVIKNLPRVPEWDKANWQNPQSPEGQQAKAVKDYCYKAGSKVKWDGARSGFGFESPPSADLLAYLRANLPGIGASLEE